MKRFTIWRKSEQIETYIVEAESYSQVLEQLNNGCHDPVNTEFIDWIDGWQLEDIEELEQLYQMVKNHKPNPKYVMTEDEKQQLINAGPVFKG
jgi:hypothetical protein